MRWRNASATQLKMMPHSLRRIRTNNLGELLIEIQSKCCSCKFIRVGANFIVSSFQGVPVVTILVGEDKVPFHVHMNILCQASSLFEKAFMGPGDFKETSEMSMTLPEEDPEIFDGLARWLYTNRIVLETETAKQSKEKAQAWYLHVAGIYIAADKYDILDLKNAAIDQCYDFLIQDTLAGPRNQVIDYVYENTTPKSKFRRLLAEGFVWHVDLDVYSNKYALTYLRGRSTDFVADVLVSMAKRANKGGNPWKLGSIEFHESAKDSI